MDIKQILERRKDSHEKDLMDTDSGRREERIYRLMMQGQINEIDELLKVLGDQTIAGPGCPNSLKDIDWSAEHRKIDKTSEEWFAGLTEEEREGVRLYEQATYICNLLNNKRPGIVS